MDLFIKKFAKVSLENRTLRKIDFDVVQEERFKDVLRECNRLPDERCDKDKLNIHYDLKHRLRYKIKRCLYTYKFIIQLLEHRKVIEKR
jgi:hypothetical protein